MALFGCVYAFLMMIGRIVLLAAGIHHIIDHLHEPTTLTASALLASGIAVYLMGDVFFRWSVQITFSRLCSSWRSSASLLFPSGYGVQVAVLLELMIVVIVGERIGQQNLAPPI